jgi:excinuclease ABC subunit C
MTKADFDNISHSLPNLPGIYKYFDDNKTIIYVGKAKDIKKRVSSYFNKNQHSFKTIELVDRIATIEFTIVNTQQDALLLENALIKQYKPKYNISLKDDKTYPYLVIKKEPFPRVFFTRRKINDGSEYIGPFTTVHYVRDLLGFIKEFVQLRTCKLPLYEKNIVAKKFKVCLEYHLGNCGGPCQGFQSQTVYNQGIQHIKEVLKGNTSEVIQVYKKQMIDYASDLNFEKAEQFKKKIEYLENYQAKSVIVSQTITHADVFSIDKDESTFIVNCLMVNNGTIVQTHTQQFEAKLDETEAEMLSFAIAQIRHDFNSIAKEIIIPIAVEYLNESIIQTIPKAGDKKRLLELSQKNVSYFKAEIRKQKILQIAPKTQEQMLEVLEQLQDDLQLSETPVHIECFDNSNFQGSFPVSACVVFKNGLPSKADYRHFKVKTVKGINDFATMKEVVFRHYKRLKDEKKSFPQLTIIDGGKGQLSSAWESVEELGLAGKLTLVGLAKNEEELFFVGDTESLKLDWGSDTLKLIRRIRDEVHRFGITFHRNQRSKGTIKNELEEISGIGVTTATTLLKTFKSVKKVKAASLQELTEVVGLQKAQLLKNNLH